MSYIILYLLYKNSHILSLLLNFDKNFTVDPLSKKIFLPTNYIIFFPRKAALLYFFNCLNKR